SPGESAASGGQIFASQCRISQRRDRASRSSAEASAGRTRSTNVQTASPADRPGHDGLDGGESPGRELQQVLEARGRPQQTRSYCQARAGRSHREKGRSRAKSESYATAL